MDGTSAAPRADDDTLPFARRSSPKGGSSLAETPEIGRWYFSMRDSRLVWSPRVEAPVTSNDFFDALHPDDRERVTAACVAATDPSRRAPYDVDYRTIGKEDGVVRWVAARGCAEVDETGRSLCETWYGPCK